MDLFYSVVLFLSLSFATSCLASESTETNNAENSRGNLRTITEYTIPYRVIPDVHAVDEDGFTQLHMASRRGWIDTVINLIANGADVNAMAKVQNFTPLHIAAVNGHKIIIQILIGRGADIDAKTTYGTTAFQIAAIQGYTEIAETFLKLGVDINVRNNKQNTALQGAAGRGHLASVILLLNHGADIDAVDLDLDTALHEAAIAGHTEIVQVLLSRGAKIIKNKLGFTAADRARQNGHKRIASLIENYGISLPSRLLTTAGNYPTLAGVATGVGALLFSFALTSMVYHPQ